MMLRITAISALLCFSLLQKAEGQRLVVNSQGDRIVMYPDGTWRHAEAGDSLLLRQYLTTTDTVKDQNPDNTSDYRKQDSPEFVARQWRELFSHIVAEDKKVQHEFRKATNAQFKAGEQLRNAETNKKLIESHQMAKLQDTYDQALAKVVELKRQQKKIRKILDKAQKYQDNPSRLNISKINRIKGLYAVYQEAHPPAEKSTLESSPVFTPIPPAPPQPPEDKKFVVETSTPKGNSVLAETLTQRSNGRIQKPAHRQPADYRVRPTPCIAEANLRDEATGLRRIELSPGVLFSHTDQDLRPYFKDKELITCRARLSSAGPYTQLILEFHIASLNAQSNFGGLPEGSLLRFKLLDGEFVSLYNLRADRGRIDPYSGHMVFVGRYALDRTEARKLRKTGLDKVRVMWTTGFEDYEVTDVDFLIHQINCLDSF